MSFVVANLVTNQKRILIGRNGIKSKVFILKKKRKKFTTGLSENLKKHYTHIDKEEIMHHNIKLTTNLFL